MNEDELKKIWQADQSTPTIDFAELQKLSDDWHTKLRRKVRIDVWAQSIATLSILASVYFHPKMIFLGLFALVLGVWYVRELRGLYRPETNEANDVAVRQSLNKKIRTMKNYFWRTRIATYGSVLPILLACFYGLNLFDNPATTTSDLIFPLGFILIISEVTIVIITEIYFKIIYAPALRQLENLRRQLDSDE